MITRELIARLQKLDKDSVVSIDITLPNGESSGDIVDFLVSGNTYAGVNYTTFFIDMKE